MYLGKYKGLPIYWKSANEKCIIVYEQFAFTRKYKLYLNGNYVIIAKQSYFYRR